MRGWSFLIVAAGMGQRFGGSPKQFEELGGRPLWEWSARTALELKDAGVNQVVLVAPPGMELLFEKVDAGFRGKLDLDIVVGGKTRQDSVLRGLEASREEMVMIHDAARPFTSVELCQRLMVKAVERGSAIPVLPVTDALKLTKEGVITGSMPRDGLVATQTPQVYRRDEIKNALEETRGKINDEAEAWLASGRELGWVMGDPLNFKITFREDLEMARRIARGTTVEKTGLGFDVHPLAPGIPLVLGGIRIPFPLGLSGHSDGDLLCHAVADAILGAAGLPDIGTLFPPSEERFRGMRSLDLLEEAVEMLRQAGYRVLSLDVVVNAQVPRLASLHGQIRDSLSGVLFRGREGRVSLKFKSGERTGDVGRGEAMRCWALARISRKEGVPGSLLDPEDGDCKREEKQLPNEGSFV
ncbi:MAG: 2-C-methyl-D-erythritol 2,4-cyclodiphosphate synthase [Thermovirga sp.]|nr:2-C-methyl-D-erythritol 2,4-cyclodiphosphate synthase [Thermovirga sp.]